jgi:Zn-dependent protease
MVKSVGVIGLAFAIASVGIANVASDEFVVLLIISFSTIGLGFLLHELAHKFVAQAQGCQAAYLDNGRMLWLTLGLAPLGLLVAAPGAVHVRGSVGPERTGLIAAAGPASNFVLALAFMILAWESTGFLWRVGATGAAINAWVGLFNMIPYGPFDGAKILAWNKVVFAVLVGVGVLLQMTV